jgi:ribosomal-protein-alanine N-acetyltransferase
MKYLLEGQETERLLFRQVIWEDFDPWLDFFKTEGIAGFLGLDQIPTAEERCTMWFDKIFHRYENDLGGNNALIDKKTGEIIGHSGLLVQEVDNLLELEVSYSILPKHWNKGYATEAAKKCRDFGFENDFADSLISIVHVANIRSEKVARHNGMTLSKKTVFKDMPVNIYRISREQWEKAMV